MFKFYDRSDTRFLYIHWLGSYHVVIVVLIFHMRLLYVEEGISSTQYDLLRLLNVTCKDP